MRKQIRVWAATGIFLGYLAGTAMAAAPGDVMVYEPLPQVESTTLPPDTQAVTDPMALEEIPQSNVSQSQLDIRDKRLEARQRRDRMLQVRAQTIQDLDAQQQQAN